MSGIADLSVRNLIRPGNRREVLPEQKTCVAWHRISFAQDNPTDDWPDVISVPDEDCDGLVVTAKFADTRRREYVERGATKWYGRSGAYTGGAIPYALLVKTDGGVDQLAEINDVTAHAGRWNYPSVGVAVVGDFRAIPPGIAQWKTCVTLAALFAGYGLANRGHDELPGGSRDPGKKCPGVHFGIITLRTAAAMHEVAGLDEYNAEAVMRECGIVF